jgi:GNAT superfamily N-acetyltransferase
MNMPVDKTSILYALEHSLFEFPQLPGCWDIPTFPGLHAHATPEVSHPFGNMVGLSTLTQENADAVIAQVQEFYGSRKHLCGWWLNPSSTPFDLVTRLEAAGFSRAVEQAGLVLTDMGREFTCNPKVTVRRATEADRDKVAHLYTVAYPMPERLAEIYTELLPMAGSGGYHYLAYVDGVEGPVSVSSMFSPRGSSIVTMQGAATLEEHRGHGIYTAMMAARVAEARAMGKEAAVLQGDRKTSAPICVKLGFEEVCSIDLYVWGNA